MNSREALELKGIAFDTLDDMLEDYFYYDRKNDAELNLEDMKNLIITGNLTKDEIMNHISKQIDIIFDREFKGE